VKRRASWVGRPWFFVAVVVLALNDHVFKGVWPGWVTGKLSDFAGLVVVATLAAVLTGPACGTVCAGVVFIGLKTVPGVAEFAAPLLGGGATLRDPTDLIALSVLPPLWWLLRRVPRPGQTRHGWIAVGLIGRLLATTATQPRPEDEVRDVSFHEGAFFVTLSTQSSSREVLRSADGGRTWSKPSSYPTGLQAADAGCTPGGTCYRIVRNEVGECSIERGTVGVWRSDGPVPGGCPHWGAVAANDEDTSNAVALAGPEGVAYRNASGTWTYVDILEIARGPKDRQDFLNAFGGGWVTLVLTVTLSVLIAAGIRPVSLAVVLIIGGWLTVPPVLFRGSFGHWKDNAPWNAGLVAASVVMIVVMAARVALGRKRGRGEAHRSSE